jgi:uncharacterized protein YbjT (DUF2867 family)
MTTTPTSDTDLTLVLGGTGKTGRRIAARLRARGVRVRIGSRAAEPGFDWERSDTWTPAVRGVDAAYISYAPDLAFPGAAETIGAFAELAVASGVERLVLLSGRGEDGAERAEHAVQESCAHWTIVRSSFFMQNFSEDFLVDAVQSGVVAFPGGAVGEPFIDIEDLADVAAAALTDPGHDKQVYEVTGPKLLTFAEATETIATAIGQPVAYVPITPDEYAAGAIDAGLPAEFARELANLFATVLDGRNAHCADGVQHALGREPRDFSEFARAAAATGVWNRS